MITAYRENIKNHELNHTPYNAPTRRIELTKQSKQSAGIAIISTK